MGQTLEFETRSQQRLAALALLCGCLAAVIHCVIIGLGDAALWNARQWADPCLTVLSVVFAGSALLLPKTRAAGWHLAIGIAMAAWVILVRYAHVFLLGMEVQGTGLMFSRYLLLFPLGACCRDEKKQIGLKAMAAMTFAVCAYIGILGILVCLDRVPAALAGQVLWAGTRLSVLYHPNITGTLYFMGFTLAVAGCFLTGKKWIKALLLAAAALFATGVALCHGRVMMLLTAGYGAGMLLLRKGFPRGKHALRRLAAALAVAVVLLGAMALRYSTNSDQLSDQYSSGVREMEDGAYVDENGKVQFTGSGQESLTENIGTLNYRTEIWRFARESIRNDPKLLLFGTEQIAPLLGGVPHAHNAWVEILLRWGLPACLAALVIAVETLVCGVYILLRSRDGWKISIALMTLAMLAVGIMEKYPFCDNTLGGFFLLCAGYLPVWAKEERRAAVQQRP